MPEKNVTDWFAWFVTGGFFGIIVLLAVRGLNATGSEAVLILVGTASGGFSAVIQYRYGSSAGSEKKSDQITDLAKASSVSTATAAAIQAAADAVPVVPVVPDPVRVEVVGEVNTTAEIKP